MTLEGNGALRLLQLFGNKSEATTITLATVTKPSPIAIRVDGDSIDTPAEGIIVAEHLAEHKRTISYSGGTVEVGGTSSSISITDGELTFKSALKKDDRVIVAIANDGQLIYVLDKAVM